ncbi:MAG: hypothetical protein ACI97N_000880, partial [Cognaticolwellia sp.]
LLKIFMPFTNWIRTEHPDIRTYFSDDLDDRNTGFFAKMILQNRTSYTLGNMYVILKLVGDFKVYEQSLLMQEFKDFILESADATIYGNKFLKDVNELLRRFRNKSAHVYTISIDQARECKFLVREILINFLALYEVDK